MASFAEPHVVLVQSLEQKPFSPLVKKQVVPALQPLVETGLLQASA